MSLQVALIALGIMLVLVVYLVSLWLERRKSHSGESATDSYHADNDGELNHFDTNGIRVLDDRVDSEDDRYQFAQGMRHHTTQEETEESVEEPIQGHEHEADDYQDTAKDEAVDTSEQQYVRQSEPAKDSTEAEPVSYIDGLYSLQIPQRYEDLEWSNASLKNLTDNSTESGAVLHESIQADIAAENVLDETRNDNAEPASESQWEPEPEQISADVATASPSGYSYPDIDGFDRVCQIDYWVKLHGDSDIGREAVLAQFRKARSALSKHNRLLGLKIYEKKWCDLEQESEDARFGDLIITLQLADQKGPVSEDELLQFSNLVAKLASGTNRSSAFMAPLESALQQAHAIADFIRYHESVFAINIKPQQTDYLDGNAINLSATRLGLERSANNYFVRNKTMGNASVCLYSLANMSDSGEFDFDAFGDFSTRGVIFFTKPAVNQSPGAVFSEMVDTAKAFAGRVDGKAVAPDHEALSREDVEQIRSSIEQMAHDMKELGMAPGSDEAIRIF